MSTLIRDTLATGAVATTATNGALAVLGKFENGNALGPINAVSHIIWGKSATKADNFDTTHTVIGSVLNAMAITGWAGIHELLMPRRRRPSPRSLPGHPASRRPDAPPPTPARRAAGHVVPKRLTPGFEEKISTKGLYAVYAVLAVALAAGSLSRNR